MLTGRFGNTTGSPYLEARIFFPRLGVRGLVSFLVDTGADVTVLMPTDTQKLGIDFGSLQNPVTSDGIGGPASGFNEHALLSFSDGTYVYSYLLQIEVAGPTGHNQRFPSLLGRDLLNLWRFVMDRSKNKITFTPRKWDMRQKI
jgi:predicted aspartyl protease